MDHGPSVSKYVVFGIKSLSFPPTGLNQPNTQLIPNCLRFHDAGKTDRIITGKTTDRSFRRRFFIWREISHQSDRGDRPMLIRLTFQERRNKLPFRLSSGFSPDSRSTEWAWWASVVYPIGKAPDFNRRPRCGKMKFDPAMAKKFKCRKKGKNNPAGINSRRVSIGRYSAVQCRFLQAFSSHPEYGTHAEPQLQQPSQDRALPRPGESRHDRHRDG